MDPKIYPQEIIHNYIQWDDSWLFSVLRKHSFKYKSDNDNELLDPPTELLKTQLKKYSLIENIITPFINELIHLFPWMKLFWVVFQMTLVGPL